VTLEASYRRGQGDVSGDVCVDDGHGPTNRTEPYMTESNRTQHDSDRRPGARMFVVRSDDDHLPDDHLPEAAAQQVESPPTSPAGSDRLVLTVDEAAYLLNISRGLAYELVARGELPAIRLGRRIVIPRLAMEELLGTPIR